MIELHRDADEAGAQRLKLAGELTIFTAAEARTRLLTEAPAPLSLEGVERIDSAGLQVLMAWSRSGEGRSVNWASAPQAVQQLMQRWRLPAEEAQQ